MKSYPIFFALIFAGSLNLSAQISWQETYGGSATDQGSAVCATSDGGYLLASNVRSIDGDITNKTTGDTLDYDIWLVKSGSSGTIEWTKAYGGTKDDIPRCVIRTSDGGFMITGSTRSNDGDFAGAGFHGVYDIFLIKVNNTGQKEWIKCFGGSGYEHSHAVIEDSDGNYILVGSTYNSGSSGDLSGTSSRGWTDVFILKITSMGEIIWKQRYGGNLDDWARDILQTEDGGYMVAAAAESYAGSGEVNVNFGNNHTYDYWILRLNENGQILWKKNFGGSSHDRPGVIRRLADGNFIIAGFTQSTNMDAAGNHGGWDGFVVKMDPDGNKLWSKTLGGSGDDSMEDILVLNDTSFMVAGYTGSADGDLTGNYGSSDGWIAHLHTNGDLLSSQNLGSSGADRLTELDLLQNGQVLITGYAAASDGDVPPVSGAADIWVLKLGDADTVEIDDPVPTEKDLVAYWPFDGNTMDSIGPYDLTASGSVTYEAGMSERSVKIENAAYLTTNTLRDYYTGTDPFTIMFWFRKESLVNHTDHIFSLGKTGSPGFDISYREELIQVRRFHWGGDAYSIRTAEEPYTDYYSFVDGLWHHVAASYNGTDLALYVDGEHIGTTVAPTSIGSQNDLYFGVERPGIWPCSGYLDEAYFYSKALTPPEIESTYQRTICSDFIYQDTVSYYVSDAAFESASPMIVEQQSDSIKSTHGGCDSIVNRYVQFIFSPVYCTDTLFYQDTLIISDTAHIQVMDTTLVMVNDTTTVTIQDTVHTEVMDTTLVTVTDTLVINAPLTGIDPPGNYNTLKVYPNPASDVLYIETGNYTRMNGYRLKIINPIGVIVFERFITDPLYEINLFNWTATGVYHLQVIDYRGDLIEVRKIILR